MLELVYTGLAWLMGAQYWWAVGLILLINYFLQRPALILMIASPLIWLDIFASETKMQIIRDRMGDFHFFAYYLLSVVLSFALYFIIVRLHRRFHYYQRMALLPVIAAYLLLLMAYWYWKTSVPFAKDALIIIGLTLAFFSSAFVLICFDSVSSKGTFNESLQRFFLLNTASSTFLHRVGAQLGPSGTDELLVPVRKREQTYYLRKKAVQVALFMTALKLFSDVVGHFFLGLPQPFLSRFALPTFELVNVEQIKTITHVMTDGEMPKKIMLQLAVAIRSFQWYFSRIAHINFKILLLWMLGLHIKLAVDEPWNSKSFADFFRRTHVYVAHFYRTFVYPLVRPVTSSIRHPQLKKSLSIWLMIFMGGFFFQTLSHSYQLMFWNVTDIKNAFILRSFSDFVLASFIVVGLLFEKYKKPTTRFLSVVQTLRFFVYVLIYSILMSISASIKSPGYHIENLFDYFRLLFNL